MYLAVDIGGTKTGVTSLSPDGQIKQRVKFPTPKDYQEFLRTLTETVEKFSTQFERGVVAVPGLIDREKGIVHSLGNLPWRDEKIKQDISDRVGGIDIVIENDAKLGGLAEGTVLKGTYRMVLYLTLSTGIGGALIEDGRIVKALQDTEMGKMPLMFGDKIEHWEEFAGGRGVVALTGRRASEITDDATWQKVGARVAYGVGILCSVVQPEAIVFGGGVGQFADKFTPTVAEYLEKELHANVRQPKALLPPHYKEDSVIYGCYELIKQSAETSNQPS